MRCYENDNIKIPKKYLKMTLEELEAEEERLYKKYKSQKTNHKKRPYTGKVKLCL